MPSIPEIMSVVYTTHEIIHNNLWSVFITVLIKINMKGEEQSMKLKDIKVLNESITFNAVEKPEGKDYYTSRYTQVDEECFLCDGSGFEVYEDKKYTCRRCDGAGKTTEDKNLGPELQVSNTNGFLILDMLGIKSGDEDYSGIIFNKDIPDLIRRLMSIKNNKDRLDSHTRPDSVYKGNMAVDRSGDIPRIGRVGPTIYDMGVDSDRVLRYVDKMLEICKYAKENDMHVSWG